MKLVFQVLSQSTISHKAIEANFAGLTRLEATRAKGNLRGDSDRMCGVQ